MFHRVTSLCQLNIRGATTKAAKHPNNFKPERWPALELASLPRTTHLRSLQRVGAKRGTIKPILNNEPIKLGARVDPTHPATLSAKSFQAPYAFNEYFNARAYPNAMLKRLGVTITPSGRFIPRPPPEREFPILQKKKRIKLAKTAVVRTRLKRKLNEAIQLVVTRGADVDQASSKIIFKESEASELKWLLRDWYYIFFPRIPIFYAPWTNLIKSVRESLTQIVEKGSEMDLHWNLESADREAKAMERLSRREMRRLRMWQRQSQEAVSRGGIAEDVGIRWKLKGMGVKKRLIPRNRKKLGDNRRAKVLRTPSRHGFQGGDVLPLRTEFPVPSQPKSKALKARLAPETRPEFIPRETRTSRLLEARVQNIQAGPELQARRAPYATPVPSVPSSKPSTAEPLVAKTLNDRSTPKIPAVLKTNQTPSAKPFSPRPTGITSASEAPETKPPAVKPPPASAKPPITKPPTAERASKSPIGKQIFIKPPNQSVLDSLRQRPTLSPERGTTPSNRSSPFGGRGQQGSGTSGKRGP
ncbi:hypothetical protein CTheo_183 [Ceratobasidium theobromae]|uniref:Uncharacterized protein n=1 Tax=Ceratobasidium theobromae TaxID=1582974 RepID=A0A5N5R1G2_9AGAM|nr:hypothetical protein CTheo_183 [Ceratobasidium theobromae]